MSQTISNLAANALAYGDGGRPVRVSIEGGDTEVSLKVHNEGPPIEASLVPVISEPFRSTAEEGTTFTLTLPRHAAAPTP